MNSEVLRNTGGRGARSVTVVLQGEGRGHFSPKSALRNISMAPKGGASPVSSPCLDSALNKRQCHLISLRTIIWMDIYGLAFCAVNVHQFLQISIWNMRFFMGCRNSCAGRFWRLRRTFVLSIGSIFGLFFFFFGGGGGSALYCQAGRSTGFQSYLPCALGWRVQQSRPGRI